MAKIKRKYNFECDLTENLITYLYRECDVY